MPDSFKTILIPVDLSINTEVAIKKALDIAEDGTELHLLYVHYPTQGLSAFAQYLGGAASEADPEAIEQKMAQWKRSIEECTENIAVHTWISVDRSVQKAIEKKASQLNASLIVIAKNSKHNWLPYTNKIFPDKIASNTGIAVLTVKPGSIYNKIRTVIVPITDKTNKHKIDAISIICKKFRVRVHLVTFTSGEPGTEDDNASSLLQIYQWLETSIHCPVEYAVLRGHNKARAILAYAEKINADILLVHAETETKIGWLDKHICDVLPPASKMQVLAVEPANTFF
jgi:nucleotide-binding universal stress UspA family protein